ncbi:MAG TPA: hypothetical protein VF328_20725 [Mycobacterium sp.]
MNTPQGPQPYRYNQPRPQHWQPYGPPQHRYPPPPPPHYAQPPAPQQPQPHGIPYGQPGEGIAVNTQFFPLAWLLFFFKPKIAVDGQEMPVAGWGRTVVPARPGQHHVHVYVPYFLPLRLGPADGTADVHPGQVAELEYKAPLWSFSDGSLGVGPQKYNGVGITIAVAAIPLALALLVIFISVLAIVI